MRRDAVRNAIWSTVVQVSRLGGAAIVFLVLSRWLPLRELGAYATAFALVQIAQAVLRAGIPEAVIQKQNTDHDYLSTAFWLSAAASILLSLLLVAIAPLLSTIVNDDLTGTYLIGLSASVLFVGLGSLSEGLLRRDLKYKALAGRTAATTVISGALSLLAAALGAGGWSLVIFSVTNALMGCVLAFAVAKFLPKLAISRRHAVSILPMAGGVVGRNLATATILPVGQLCVATFLGAGAAGAYMIANRLLTLASSLTLEPARDVALPLFSRVKNDPVKREAGLIEALRILSVISAPVYMGLAATAPVITTIILGSAKSDVVAPILMGMCLHGLPFIISLLSIQALTSVGRPGEAMKFTLVQAGSNLAVSLVAAQISAAAVGIGYGLRAWLVTPVVLLQLRAHLDMKLRAVLDAGARPYLVSTAMAISVWWLAKLNPTLSPIVTLSLQTAVGAILYAAGLLVAAPDHTAAILRTVKQLFRRA